MWKDTDRVKVSQVNHDFVILADQQEVGKYAEKGQAERFAAKYNQGLLKGVHPVNNHFLAHHAAIGTKETKVPEGEKELILQQRAEMDFPDNSNKSEKNCGGATLVRDYDE